jgi:hypothetical protein
MNRRRAFLVGFAALASFGAHAADPVPDWAEIQRVIAAQRDALKAGNGERAFAHAAPSIRAQFGSPANFLAMVRTGYAPLLEAIAVEFLEGAVIEGRIIQPLRLILPDNTVVVALYTAALQPDGAWRITACVLAPSTMRAA